MTPEEERADEALLKSIARLEELMLAVRAAEKRIARHGSLKELRKTINEKKKKGIHPEKLEALAKEVQQEYRGVETEIGIKIGELKVLYERISPRQGTPYRSQEMNSSHVTCRLVVNIAKELCGKGLPLLDRFRRATSVS